MTELTIRPATINEAAAIAALIRASITELCIEDHAGDHATIDKWLENKTEDEIRNWLACQDRAIYLAYAENTIAAAGCHNTRGIVLMNYIAPSHRMRGISSAMLAHLEDRMRKSGLSESRLVSTATARLCGVGPRRAGSASAPPAPARPKRRHQHAPAPPAPARPQAQVVFASDLRDR